MDKLTTTSKLNTKGQIVLPKEYRDLLNIKTDDTIQISLKGNTICINLLKEVVLDGSYEDSYTDILKKTVGSWGDLKDQELDIKDNIEITAAKKRRSKKW
jgi:AbrB family looped-hinge helix DNA binding protein